VLVDKNSKIILKHSEISLREDGIVEVVFLDNAEINLGACIDITNAYGRILEDKQYPLLHFVGDYTNFTNEAREYSASERGLQYSKAEAYVFTSLGHRLLAKFYISINKPSVPTQFFKTEQEAVLWLKGFL